MEQRRPGLYVDRLRREPQPAPLRSDIAAFIGRAPRGPVGRSIRVEGWREFERVFGGLGHSMNLPFAVRGYFENGGEIAYVVRVGRSPSDGRTAVPGDFLYSAAPAPVGPGDRNLGLHAASPGGWADSVRAAFRYRRNALGGVPQLEIRVRTRGFGDELIGPIALDRRLLEEEPGDPDVDPLVRAIANRSWLVRCDTTLAAVAAGAGIPPGARVEWDVSLTGGRDGAVDAQGYQDALTAVCDEPDPALLAFPDLGLDLTARDTAGELTRDEASELLRRAIELCEQLKDRMVLLEVPAAGSGNHPPLEASEAVDWANVLRDESLAGGGRAAAIYHPWLRVRDPIGGSVSPLRHVPPCGHVAGVISRSDRERGASHTPANLPLYDAVDLSRGYTEGEESDLNRLGVNMIRCVPGAGLKVWGGGTLARSGPGDTPQNRFVAHRRLINRLVRAIRRVAEPLVFDNNGPELWLTIVRGINSVLFEAFQHGALKGNRPEEAYVIRCDAKTNPLEVIEEGRVYCEVEVAPAAPMEFILIGLSFGGDGRLEVFES